MSHRSIPIAPLGFFCRVALWTLVLAGMISGARVQAQSGSPSPQERDLSRARAIERWNQLDSAGKAELRRRFAAVEHLSKTEREAMAGRVRRLRRELDETLESLAPEERARIQALPAAERDAALRGILGDRARVGATRLRERMTPAERTRLGEADPGERRAIIRALHDREIRDLPAHYGELARALGVDRSALEGLRQARGPERTAAIAAFARERAKAYVRGHGLPAGISTERWQQIVALPDSAFLRNMVRIRCRYPDFAIPHERYEQRAKQRRSLLRRLESLEQPSTGDRVARPRGREQLLRRVAVVRNREEIEALLVQRLGGRERAALQERLEALDDDGFVAALRAAQRALRAGEDPLRAIEGRRQREGSSGARSPRR